MADFRKLAENATKSFAIYADLEAIDVASDGAGENNNATTTEIEQQCPAIFGAITG